MTSNRHALLLVANCGWPMSLSELGMGSKILTRRLRLLHLLQAGVPYSIDQLSAQLFVSARTLQRDLKQLQAAGEPIALEGATVRLHQQLGESTSVPKLTEEELLTLALAAHLSPMTQQEALGGTIRSAIGKLVGSANAEVQAKVQESLQTSIRVPSRIDPSQHEQLLVITILEALKTRRQLLLSYREPHREEPIETRLTPFRLVVADVRWSVIGFSTRHRATMKFELVQIAAAEVTNDPCQPRRRRFRIDARPSAALGCGDPHLPTSEEATPP